VSPFVLVIMLVRAVDGGVGAVQIEMPSQTACEREASKILAAPKPLGSYSNPNTAWVFCVDRRTP
jgi:hypothetical protein